LTYLLATALTDASELNANGETHTRPQAPGHQSGRSESRFPTPTAIWLPAGASAFNVVIMKRFFDNLPRELFEAARLDGAGPLRLFLKIVLPLSKPILGVVSIFAILSEWKNFLWPFLILSNSPDRQPLSVRLPAIQAQTQIGVLLAAMLIAALVPLLGFLIFHRTFLRGTGLGGALKG
jgi:multiple sugar transport system permease protein